MQIPNQPANLPAGVYTVSAIIGKTGEPDHISNELPLPIAPTITNPMPLKVKRVKGAATVKLTCSPAVHPDQRLALLLGDQEIQAIAVAAPAEALSFIIPNAVPGTYFVRLRVDGVDTHIIDHSAPLLAFDTTQQVTIT